LTEKLQDASFFDGLKQLPGANKSHVREYAYRLPSGRKRKLIVKYCGPNLQQAELHGFDETSYQLVHRAFGELLANGTIDPTHYVLARIPTFGTIITHDKRYYLLMEKLRHARIPPSEYDEPPFQAYLADMLAVGQHATKLGFKFKPVAVKTQAFDALILGSIRGQNSKLRVLAPPHDFC